MLCRLGVSLSDSDLSVSSLSGWLNRLVGWHLCGSPAPEAELWALPQERQPHPVSGYMSKEGSRRSTGLSRVPPSGGRLALLLAEAAASPGEGGFGRVQEALAILTSDSRFLSLSPSPHFSAMFPSAMSCQLWLSSSLGDNSHGRTVAGPQGLSRPQTDSVFRGLGVTCTAFPAP